VGVSLVAVVVEPVTKAPDDVTLCAKSRFAGDQLSVREAALLAVSITSDFIVFIFRHPFLAILTSQPCR
jgi:hypothetical protein